MSYRIWMRIRGPLLYRVDQFDIWLQRPPTWWRFAKLVATFAAVVVVIIAVERGWDIEWSHVAFYWLALTALDLWRRNRRLRRDNAYLADRLARVEPVPITILDGLGRDINHLDDAERQETA